MFNIGFTSHVGTVAAADEWDEPCRRKDLRKVRRRRRCQRVHALSAFMCDLPRHHALATARAELR